MIKIFCDICSQEPKNSDFLFEATIMEVRESYNLTNKNLNPQKQMFKQQIQICQDCYNKHFKELLYGQKANKAISGEVIK